MTKKLAFFFVTILISVSSFGQIIDRLSITVGPTFSTQLWTPKLNTGTENFDYKLGFLALVTTERKLNRTLGLRSEFGYIQKGFKSNFVTVIPNGTETEWDKNYVKLHNLALGLGVKISPFISDYSPYLLIGIRGDYMFSYRDAIRKDIQGASTYHVYENLLKEYNKFNAGGLFALGVDLKNLFYLEIEYNPGFTKNFDSPTVDIKDKCWSTKLGFYIQK